MPKDHQKYIQWNGEHFIRWESKIGANIETVVKAVLDGYKKPALLILDEWLLYQLKESEAKDILEIAEA